MADEPRRSRRVQGLEPAHAVIQPDPDSDVDSEGDGSHKSGRRTPSNGSIHPSDCVSGKSSVRTACSKAASAKSGLSARSSVKSRSSARSHVRKANLELSRLLEESKLEDEAEQLQAEAERVAADAERVAAEAGIKVKLATNRIERQK